VEGRVWRSVIVRVRCQWYILREQRTLTSAPGTAAGTTIRPRLWCPAHAALETGSMDAWVEYLCGVAHERAGVIREGVGGNG
jgi:hypothetical protein